MTDLKVPDDRSRRVVGWGLIPCLVIALGCALVPLTTSLALGAPLWVGLVAALAVFPGLPLLWHLLAEHKRPKTEGGWGTVLRFGLRSLAVGLVVLLVSLANVGPRQLSSGLLALFRPEAPSAPALPPKVPAPPVEKAAPEVVKSVPRHELEPFIPADASAVAAISDPTLVAHLLTAVGGASEDAVAGFEKCQIHVEKARILIASRDRDTRMVVVRAPGITDPRNLYCLAGFLGSERVRLRFFSDKAPIRFRLAGLLPQALEFSALDADTLMAKHGSWEKALGQTLFPADADAPRGALAGVLGRVDRSAGAWVAGLFASEEGLWDLALDAHVDTEALELSGSSIPPSGESDKAAIDTRVPLSFAMALPGAAFPQGLRALGALLVTADGAASAAALPGKPAASADAGPPVLDTQAASTTP